ncbi:MAG: O-antigen ligase family protein [Deltaproteobacteria bacterium]|nr:O-antigen ligase family protein [Deltaproteobacteria bacterium]
MGALALMGLTGVFVAWGTRGLLATGVTFGNFLPLLLPVAAAALSLILIRPVMGALAVLAFSFVNPASLPTLAEFGEFSIRLGDVFLGILLLSVFFRVTLQNRMIVSQEFAKLFVPLSVFLLYIGLSLVNVALNLPNHFLFSLASYLRLVLTAFFGLLLHIALVDRRTVISFHRAFLGLCMLSIIVAGWEAWQGIEIQRAAEFSSRFEGLLGVNSLGLVSGLLVLYAVVKKRDRYRTAAWPLLFCFGVLGLFLAKSASSILATCGSLAIYWASRQLGNTVRKRYLLLKLPVATLAMIVVTGLAVSTLRPGDFRGLVDVTEGSFVHRLVITYAGLRIFFEHPLLGVGWQGSGTMDIVGSAALNTLLMDKFMKLPDNYFFLQSATSLHNMYIQFLGELGILGFLLFVLAGLWTAKAVIRILSNIPIGSPYEVAAQFYAFGLLFLLIWWNTNPLFGGQVESTLAFSFLGALAAVARLERLREKDASTTSRDSAT